MAGPNENKIEKNPDKPLRVPTLTLEEKQKIIRLLPEVRQDLSDFKKNLAIVRKDHPEIWGEIKPRSQFMEYQLNAMNTIVDQLSSENKALRDSDLIQGVNEFNFIAREINNTIASVDRMTKENREKTMTAALRGELPFDENKLTAEEKKELQIFAQNLWNELFPNSNVDKFVLWATGRRPTEDPEDYEKILLAPANGIEAAVAGMIELFNPQTYKDIYSMVKTTTGMSYNEWCASVKALKFSYEQLSTSSKIAPLLSFLCSFLFLFGGFKALTSLSKFSQLKCGTKVKAMLEAFLATRAITHYGAEIGKTLPFSNMFGLSLRYINYQNVS